MRQRVRRPDRGRQSLRVFWRLAFPLTDLAMDDRTANEVMQRFGKAFFSREPAEIAKVITEDAEWHFAIGEDGADGRVRKGLAGFMQGIADNDALFASLRFEKVVCRGFGTDQIVMTYLVRGQLRAGSPFALRGIELITVRDGRVALKDVFWKQYRATE
jgi:ketosteroid isomerase-like protein